MCGERKELGRSRQVGFCSEEIDVPHVGREPGQVRVKVDAFAVPPSQPVNGERVPQIARTRTDATTRRLEAGFPVQLGDRLPSGAIRKLGLADSDEETVRGASSCEFMADAKVVS